MVLLVESKDHLVTDVGELKRWNEGGVDEEWMENEHTTASGEYSSLPLAPTWTSMILEATEEARAATRARRAEEKNMATRVRVVR